MQAHIKTVGSVKPRHAVALAVVGWCRSTRYNLRMSERKLRQWRLRRTRDPVVETAIGGLTIGVVLMAIALTLLVGWAVGTALGSWMFVAANLTPNYPVHIAGFTFPGYTALYTVVLNIVVAVVLTPVFNAMRRRPAPIDATVAADYYA